MRRTVIAALLLCTIAILAPPANATSLNLSAGKWTRISNNKSVKLLNANGALYLDVPVMPNSFDSEGRPSCLTPPPGHVDDTCASINYLYTRNGVAPKILSGYLVVTLTVSTTGSPVFHQTEEVTNPECPYNPPTVRALIWSHNTSYADGDRWWSHDVSYVLGAGTVTMTIPVNPAYFSGVDGEMANANDSDPDATVEDGRLVSEAWSSAIANVSGIGVTFGGGCNYGHGVFVVGGTARFTLSAYNIDPPQPCPAATVGICPGLPGSNCAQGREIGSTSTGHSECVKSDGSLFYCHPGQSANLVSTNCTTLACCTGVPSCLCFTCPPEGQYLDCR